MKKILLIFITILGFTNNVYAETCNVNDLPALPENPENFIVVKFGEQYYAYILNNSFKPYITNKEYIIVNSTKSYFLRNDLWNDNGTDYSALFNEIIQTSVDIYTDNTLKEIAYNKNYGLACEVTDNNVGAINDIAHLINDFYKDLESKNIKFYQIMIALIIFDFIVFVFCYIITHFRF